MNPLLEFYVYAVANEYLALLLPKEAGLSRRKKNPQVSRLVWHVNQLGKRLTFSHENNDTHYLRLSGDELLVILISIFCRFQNYLDKVI